MKLVIVAGTPGAGKTAILTHTLKILKDNGYNPAVVKVDCLHSEDDKVFKKLDIPTKLGLAMDMCPDHFTIFNIEEMIHWARENESDLLIVETAGLCHRCAPYTQNCLGVCVIDATQGPNTPLKVGPFLSTADIVVITKGDLISQAEREIFRERIIEVNPESKIIEANGLSGQGCAKLAFEITKTKDLSLKNEKLRYSAPLAICTLCVGERRIGKKYHRGVLRNIDGFQRYEGE
ncbi:cobalamin synthesis protein P47K [Methanothermus fervidus DSM 2088]|uniref:Cobalamin synthesis protein P47K n=1 Tax=Methanothermus fervidus (strain ATCC 43054 / DSM 2088 / JCM 10308 / V24 S) TaxID=523846 RepID=E3GW88_METFV|nr:GTP-binding protein [Methanothermus fervidus]ADP77853.1 cobalamin synthesis protein P47K [Methanothermus fervidus DSM 2088]